MKVVLLAGGLGTRLREETETKPKPMVEVGGYPILWHIMKHYSHYGYNEFVISVGYKGNMIKKYFRDYAFLESDLTVDLGTKDIKIHDHENKEKWKVTVVDTGLHTQTGGRIKGIQKYIDGPFLATYGDGVSDVPIDKLVEFHKKNQKTATITAVHPPSRFGEVVINDDNATIHTFAEKPQTSTGWISAGFFVFEPEVFKHIEGPESQLERDMLEPLAKNNQLCAYQHEGCWRCMDTYREFTLLNKEWSSGKAKWKVW